MNREFYALRINKTGELARIVTYNEGRSYELCSDSDEPVFEAQSLDQLGLVLFENTPGYNSSSECPGWGGFKAAELQPVKVSVVTEMEELELPVVRQVKTVEVRSTTHRIARSYAGCEMAGMDPDKRMVFWLVELPAGMTLADAQAWEGEVIYAGDKFTRRTLYKAIAVPPEYEPLVVGKSAALFFASEL